MFVHVFVCHACVCLRVHLCVHVFVHMYVHMCLCVCTCMLVKREFGLLGKRLLTLKDVGVCTRGQGAAWLWVPWGVTSPRHLVSLQELQAWQCGSEWNS